MQGHRHGHLHPHHLPSFWRGPAVVWHYLLLARPLPAHLAQFIQILTFLARATRSTLSAFLNTRASSGATIFLTGTNLEQNIDPLPYIRTYFAHSPSLLPTKLRNVKCRQRASNDGGSWSSNSTLSQIEERMNSGHLWCYDLTLSDVTELKLACGDSEYYTWNKQSTTDKSDKSQKSIFSVTFTHTGYSTGVLETVGANKVCMSECNLQKCSFPQTRKKRYVVTSGADESDWRNSVCKVDGTEDKTIDVNIWWADKKLPSTTTSQSMEPHSGISFFSVT